jgi:glycosyltransferase involved in cell wall biosynthesis
MKIVQVHNLYDHRGGEEVVLELERKLLTTIDGYEVVQYLENNRVGLSGLGAFKAVVNYAFSLFSRKDFQSFIDLQRPEVIHFHNIFPKLGPGLFKVAKKSGALVVVTIHNYRYACANGLFLYNSKPCTLCLKKPSLLSVFRRCYRNSLIATLVMYFSQVAHRRLGFYEYPDFFIVMTEFSKKMLESYGVPSAKILIKPHSVDDVQSIFLFGGKKENDFIYVGRLSVEKGLLNVIDRIKNYKILVVGDGQQRKEIEVLSENGAVTFAGWQTRENILKHCAASKFLIFPSIWFETYGLVIAEAFSVGCPVIARDVGGVSDLVKHGYNGFLFKSDSELDAILDSIDCMPDETYSKLCLGARNSFLDFFSHAKNTEDLVHIYGERK